MELSGLVFVVIVGAIVFYVAPARVAKRHAVATSREGDRFHEELALVHVETASPHVGPHAKASFRVKSKQTLVTRMPTPSTKPILASPRTRGANMSDSSKPETPSEAALGQPLKLHPAREYAALRARRAARRANEKAAAQRRVVSLALASLVFLLFTGLAASGIINWGWLLVPAAVMVASLASSMVAASRTRDQDAADAARLAELKGALASIRKRQSGKAAPAARIRQVKKAAKRSVVTSGRSVVVDAVWKPVEDEEGPTTGSTNAADSATGDNAKQQVSSKDVAPDIVEAEVVSDVEDAEVVVSEVQEQKAKPESTDTGSADSESAGSGSAGSGSAGSGLRRFITEELAFEEDELAAEELEQTKKVNTTGDGASTPATSEQAPTAKGWDVVAVPPPAHTLKPKVTGRAVHPDTDLVEIVSPKRAAVPMRPIRKSTPSVKAPAEAPAAAEPAFKFDLDSILEQRRAQ